jgi:O-6-methylguanine DNA methyltransferase
VTLRRSLLSSPLGALVAVTDARDALRALDFADCEPRLWRLLRRQQAVEERDCAEGPAPAKLRDALAGYFDGDLRGLAALETDARGPAFQRRVWRMLREVPPGATTSYGALARALGAPNAARAVGAANGANPIALVVPCHRVVGASGALTGYAGGLARKRWLLDHENRWSDSR